MHAFRKLVKAFDRWIQFNPDARSNSAAKGWLLWAVNDTRLGCLLIALALTPFFWALRAYAWIYVTYDDWRRPLKSSRGDGEVEAMLSGP